MMKFTRIYKMIEVINSPYVTPTHTTKKVREPSFRDNIESYILASSQAEQNVAIANIRSKGNWMMD